MEIPDCFRNTPSALSVVFAAPIFLVLGVGGVFVFMLVCRGDRGDAVLSPAADAPVISDL